MKFWLSNEDETRRAGAALAAVLLPLARSAPVVVFVRGNLGAGKSTFVRGFLTRAGVTGVMPSPTYSLVEPYQTDTLNVFHMDAYRIADGAELDYLGLDEIERPGSILLVEWPDHVRDELPAPTATVDLAMSLHPDRRNPNPAQSPARDRHNSAKPLGAARDRHNSAKPLDQSIQDRHNLAKDRHNSAKPSGQSTQDRHNSAKPLGQPTQDRRGTVQETVQDRHDPAVQDRHDSAKLLDQGQALGQPLDSHSSDFDQVKNQTKDRLPADFDREKCTERHYASEVGRLLKVTLAAVPVQVEQRLNSSRDWQGLFRVVT